jgi:hypothetical protein
VAGEVAPNWQISAGYAHLDARITESVARQNGVALEDRAECRMDFDGGLISGRNGFFINYGYDALD